MTATGSPQSSSYWRELVDSLSPEELEALRALTTPKLTKWIPHKPTPAQTVFLLDDSPEALYGGAAGGGKSDALLMAALQYVDVPGYSAILFRRSYQDLALPGALIPRSKEWLRGRDDCQWNGERHEWRFESGATLAFGYLQTEDDKYRYQSAEFQFIGFDELTQFSETSYLYLHSRARRPSEGPLSKVPIRIRAASNPGGQGHEWVKRRFIDFPEGRSFVPAKLSDNPFLDADDYRNQLANLDEVTRQQLLDGNWQVTQKGGRFDPESWIRHDYRHDRLPDGAKDWTWCRYWDMAATEEKPGRDPDYACGTLMGRDERNEVWVVDVTRTRGTPKEVEDLVVATAQADRMLLGDGVQVRMEQEPGSSGKTVIDSYARTLIGFPFDGIRSTGDKATRALPFSTYMQRGLVHVIMGPWWEAWRAELTAFPQVGVHDDQVDSGSGAFAVVGDGYVGGASAAVGGAAEKRGGSTRRAATAYHARRGAGVSVR